MTPKEIDDLKFQIRQLREECEEFEADFACLTDDQLREIARQQREVSEDALWKAGAADAMISLRAIAKAATE